MRIAGHFGSRASCEDFWNSGDARALEAGTSPLFWVEFEFPLPSGRPHVEKLPALIDTGAEVTAFPGWRLGVHLTPGGKVGYRPTSPIASMRPKPAKITTAAGRQEQGIALDANIAISAGKDDQPVLRSCGLNVRILPTVDMRHKPFYALIGQDVLVHLSLLHAPPARSLLLGSSPIWFPAWFRRMFWLLHRTRKRPGRSTTFDDG